MNILLVCASYGGGGAERVAANLSSAMSTQGHNVSFYYWIDKEGQEYKLSSSIVIVKAPGRNIISRIIGLRRQISKTHPDVVIGYTDVSNIICYGALLNRRNRPIFIATIHSDLHARDKNLRLTWRFRLLRHLHRQCCLFAEKVVAVSDGARVSLLNYYQLPSSRVERIYNPVLDSINIPSGTNKIITPWKLVAAGRLTTAKNYPLLFTVVSLLINKYNIPCELTIYGEGELRKELEKLNARLGLTEVIKLEGFANNFTDRLKSYDIFVLSSSWEGLPTVLVEALNAGLRVVSTDCPSGPSEILAQGKYGELAPINNAEKLALAIIRSAAKPVPPQNNELYAHLYNFTNEATYKKYMRLITHTAEQTQD